MTHVRAALPLAMFFAGLGLSPAVADHPAPVRIGMVKTLFTDIPQPLVNVFMPIFSGLMKDLTGLEGKILPGDSALEVGRKLHEDQLQLAVFQGVEFAWAQQKYQDLRPLMVAVNGSPHVRALLVVHQESNADGFGFLKGKDIAIPRRSREHHRLFLARNCTDCGCQEPKSFFAYIHQPSGVENALDKVASGDIPAALVDNQGLEFYTHLQPGRAKRLRVVKASEIFPTGVVAYRHGAIDNATLEKFKTGMINAKKNEKGRELLQLFNITGFEPVPADYAQTLAEIIRTYPAPAADLAPKTANRAPERQ